jgi:MFS transporter, NNP family, nitrate/nitrite transporter
LEEDVVTVSGEPDVLARSPGSARTVATLVLATVGLGLNLRAWILLGPQLHDRFDVSLGAFVLLVGLPLLVAALIRLPVGVLTDRYGARVMFPAVSLAAAASACGLGLAGSLPAAVAFGAVAGTAGSAFVVGGALLSRMLPYGRRGVALGVFSLGPAIAVAISALSRAFDPDGQRAALVLAGSLVAFAGLAALVLRDPVPARPGGSSVRTCLEMVRLASATWLSLLYALALGGIVAVSVYLPVYLATVLELEWFSAVAVTGVVVGLAAVSRLVGGWWTDRRPTARLLTVCYALAAGLCLVLAVHPPRWWLTAPVIAAIAVCDGTASGVLLALIGKAARTDSVGAVMGMTGAMAALGALLPAVLLVGVDVLGHSPAAGWLLLAAALLAVAVYVRVRGLRVSLGLAVHFAPEPSPTAMTVAVVDESDTRLGAAAVVARLAELAASDELVVVYGSDRPETSRLSSNILVAGLRDRLPRHGVVGLSAALYAGAQDRLAAILGDFVEAGSVAVAVTPTADLRRVAARLCSRLRADRLMMVSFTLTDGAGLYEIWRRSATPNEG